VYINVMYRMNMILLGISNLLLSNTGNGVTVYSSSVGTATVVGFGLFNYR